MKLSIALSAGLLVASGSTGQEMSYTQRIQMPIRGDAFKQPRAVVVDLHADEVFVCDTFNNRIVIFDEQGLFEYAIPGGESFRSPIDLAVGPEGYLLVLGFFGGRTGYTSLDFDGKFIERVDLSGLPDGLDKPDLGSLALSPDGTLVYSIDNENHRLWISDRQGVIQGSVDYEKGRTEDDIEDLRLAQVDVFNETVLVAVPSDGLVYLYDLRGRGETFVGLKGTVPCRTAFPVAASLDSEGRILILDKQRAVFMLWDPQENKCLDEYMGFGNAPGGLYQPGDIALDASGRVYIAQGFEGRVQVYEGAFPAAQQSKSSSPTP